MRRDFDTEVEFVTRMWFAGFGAIRSFVAEHSTKSHVPDAARRLIPRFDEHAMHYNIIQRCAQLAAVEDRDG